MKAKIQLDELRPLASRLQKVCDELEDMRYIYEQQTIDDSTFTGNMVNQYQRLLSELLNEHQRIIEYYRDLSEQIIEIEQDFSSSKEILLNKLQNL